MEDNSPDIIGIFKSKGLRGSEQRIAIYDFLLKNRIHPGAEEIFKFLQNQHPTLSLTTVYNTLKAFEAHGLVTPITIENGELRYDVNVSFHAHFKCRKCQRLFDVDSPTMDMQKEMPTGFKVEAVHLDYYGICPDCAE